MFSYYTAKTRAYLNCKRIPYVETYDGLLLNGPIKEKTHKVMIPVLQGPEDEVLQDTTVINDVLEARYPERPIFPQPPELMFITRLVEFFIDEFWITTAMNTRWNDAVSKQFAIHEFGNVLGRSFGLEGEAAFEIGHKIADQMQSYLPMLGIDDESNREIVDAFFRKASHALNLAVGPQRFAFGRRPSLIDCILYTGYYAHQYRDAGQAQIVMKRELPNLCYFLDQIHAGQGVAIAGDLEMTEAFEQYLKVIGPTCASFAAATQHAVAERLSNVNVGEVCDGVLSPYEFELDGQKFSRGGSVFAAWKLQRVRDAYDRVGDDAREQLDQLVVNIGWAEVLADVPSFRLDRVDHQTTLESI
ncbi:MAG: glutathione S-transferase N-terminal domain-containing protein [Pseudomonadota bacterium]